MNQVRFSQDETTNSETGESGVMVPFKEDPALQPAVYKAMKDFHNVMKSCPATMEMITARADQDFKSSTKLVEERARELDMWRGKEEALILKLREEITMLENTRKRVERALVALQVPDSIRNQCDERRPSRIGHDNISDGVDEALFHEKNLIDDVGKTLTACLEEIKSQLDSDKVCKVQLEFDWSDKTAAFRLETVNVGLKAKEPVAFFPGATRLQNNQSSPDHWMHYTKEHIAQAESVLQRSSSLRGRADLICTKTSVDLRDQANTVELALQKNIAATQQALEDAERELAQILSQISLAETLHGKLARLAEQCDCNMKISQTRLTHRAARPRGENMRDSCQHNLIGEVSHLNESAACIHGQMEAADAALQALYEARALLEVTITVKRKSLYIDRHRCLVFRKAFPDSTTLAGF